MSRVILCCVLLTVSFSLMAEPQKWMKKDDPNSLGLYVFHDYDYDCPFEQSELEKQAKGEYLRARIKPTRNPIDLNITIDTTCSATKNTADQLVGYNMYSSIEFKVKMTEPYASFVSLGGDYYSALITTGPDKDAAKTVFFTSFRDRLSEALTDYLKANFE